jgi:hypothetical protein
MNAELTWTPWRKSSYSGTSGNCVEVAQATWGKSSISGQSQNCVEIAGDLPAAIGVRDSKDPSGPVLVFAPGVWRAFITGVKNRRFDQQ